MVKPLVKMLVKVFLLMLELMAKPLVVDDAEVDVEALRQKVGEGIVDDGDDVACSSPTPLG